ncbi:hypothetical protein [Wukongibacter sp. M2B1]|uniref:hypothetical protein n=1 Tax=Wukongibacter sp. M2B1 TaxID=3088895 RepID=UPI003D7C01C3
MGCCGGGYRNHKDYETDQVHENTMQNNNFTKLALLIILILVISGGIAFYFLK